MSFIYLAPLFLYFPRFLPGIETQPLLPVLVAVCGLAFGSNKRPKLAFVGLVTFLLMWIAIRIGFVGTPSASIVLLQILLGPIAAFAAMALRAAPPPRNIMRYVAIYFVGAAVLEILAPSAYSVVASAILTRFNVTDGHRGISLFTPEPTYASITLIYFLLLSYWSGVHWGFKHRWVEWVLGFSLVATLSTYVGVFLLALAFAWRPRLSALIIAASVVAIPALNSAALGNDDSIRAIVALSRLLATDFTDLLPSLSLMDSSMGSRLLTNVASFQTPWSAPWGHGMDCNAVPSAFAAAGFDFAFDNPVLASVMEDGCLKPQSYAAAIALGLGAAALPFVLLLALSTRFALRSRRTRFWSAPLAIAIVLLSIQGQLTSPIPWLLLYFAFGTDRRFEVKRAAVTNVRPPTSDNSPLLQ